MVGIFAIRRNAALRARYLVATALLLVAVCAPIPSASASVSWAHERTGIRSAWNVTRGAGVTVAVIDSGLAVGGHSRIDPRLQMGRDFSDGDDTPWDDPAAADYYGHGTSHVGVIGASVADDIADGVAPEATIRLYRALGTGPNHYHQAIASSIIDATDRGIPIISIALSTGSDSGGVMQAALQYAQARGVLTVCAAGNSASSTLLYPAIYPECLAVGGTAPSDALYGGSNYGPDVDIVAPGSDISLLGPGQSVLEGRSGTSWAAPHVAGIAALMLASGTPKDQLRATLLNTAVDLGAPGKDDTYAGGLVQAPFSTRTPVPEFVDFNGYANRAVTLELACPLVSVSVGSARLREGTTYIYTPPLRWAGTVQVQATCQRGAIAIDKTFGPLKLNRLTRRGHSVRIRGSAPAEYQGTSVVLQLRKSGKRARTRTATARIAKTGAFDTRLKLAAGSWRVIAILPERSWSNKSDSKPRRITIS